MKNTNTIMKLGSHLGYTITVFRVPPKVPLSQFLRSNLESQGPRVPDPLLQYAKIKRSLFIFFTKKTHYRIDWNSKQRKMIKRI